MRFQRGIILVLATALSISAAQKQRYFRDPAVKSPRQPGSGIAVVNAASFLEGVSPGGLTTVFGTNLTDVSGVVLANSNPFPSTLANVSVYVNGVAAPIFSIAYNNGEDQISFQVPWETDTGPGAAFIQIFDYGAVVGTARVDSFIEDPGIFAYQRDGAQQAVAVHGSDYALITPDDPAAPGEVIVLYTTGLGLVNVAPPNGFGAPASPLAHTLDPFDVVVARESARVLFSGLAPGFVGLYQINVQLPLDLPAGALPVQITSPYASSQTASLSVE